MSTDLTLHERGCGAVCRDVLATLPTWFGMADANDDYVRTADTTPTAIARLDGDDVGLLTVVTHSPYAAEVHLMAVRPEHHRQGVGRALLSFVEDHLVATGIEYLQVKTLSSSHPDTGYALTRAFYAATGFRPLEEFPLLWGPDQPALQMVKRL